MLLRFFKTVASPPERTLHKAEKLATLHGLAICQLRMEICYYVELDHQLASACTNGPLSPADYQKLLWLLGTPFDENNLTHHSALRDIAASDEIIRTFEIGPRLTFSTPFSTNAVSMCHAVGLTDVTRLEMSQRYELTLQQRPVADDSGEGPGGAGADAAVSSCVSAIANGLHDRMTHCRYERPLEKLSLVPDSKCSATGEDSKRSAVYEVDVVGRGRKALQAISVEMGLAFDEWDLDYYTELFAHKIGRNPTNVECFDLAQSNSEHSRHWFFRGRIVVDGEEQPETLFKMVMGTQSRSNSNNVIKFSDNSSAIEGFHVTVLVPSQPGEPCSLEMDENVHRHIIFTAETHNFPTGVAPFPGATTGTGGRIRDVQATGTGAHVIAGTAGYCFGNLCIDGYDLPWEDKTSPYPSNFARPLDIAVEASNGASDYGNKFGEPLIVGFARSFGLRLPASHGGERYEWVKPIMFSGGIGSIDARHVKKDAPATGMSVVKIGGPVYRIGVGGGAASSVHVQGDSSADLDFNAVQRGDGEMEQKLNRVVRACAESGTSNPIRCIHDQGAGGNGNVLKEIVEPAGAVIYADAFGLGDASVGALELWGAEYQESNAALVAAGDDSDTLRRICRREKCPVSFVGTVTGNGKIRLEDFGVSPPTSDIVNGNAGGDPPVKRVRTMPPVDLELEHVLGSMPSKVFNLSRRVLHGVEDNCFVAAPLAIDDLLEADGVTVMAALERVLRLPSVGSKRYLTSKVDRSVTGLVAQQQCVGPLHTPLADVGVVALSHIGAPRGGATSIGEQPIKTLVCPARGARMSVGESLTNLAFAAITDLRDVKCSGNWMWAAKLPGEGAALYDACRAMCDVMGELGVAVDGGKDSLSMAARIGQEIVKAPGALVISSYAPCTDVTLTVTPDLKCPDGKGTLVYINLSKGQSSERLGGTALAQCFNMLGDESPDLDDSGLFVKAFSALQTLLEGRRLYAGHDVSDGGVLVAVLEMAFAGNCGVDVLLPYAKSKLSGLFHEELGFVLEVAASDAGDVVDIFKGAGVLCSRIGYSLGDSKDITVSVERSNSAAPVADRQAETVVCSHVATLRDLWEETSFQLELNQTDRRCALQERDGMKDREAPPYRLTFDLSEPIELPNPSAGLTEKHKVAIIREEGSNGDREMAAAFHMAGFEVWDVCMQDMCSGTVTSLAPFRGIAFVGGFSYADVLGSAKGWAAAILFNPTVRRQFDEFYTRRDTFSLGVCNGCQLMTLLGWVGASEQPQTTSITDAIQDDSKASHTALQQGVFMEHNESGRYESRFATVCIDNSPSILLKGMEKSILGIWVAHGEGKMRFKTPELYEFSSLNNLVPLKYVDDRGEATTVYPFNPNGSSGGAAALCSPDGRHLAMMPHPERCVLPWQWPWMPLSWRRSFTSSPWLRLFKNANHWCCT